MKKYFCVFILFFHTSVILPQIVYTDNDEEVNLFLKRLSLKNIIQLNDEVKPYTRVYVAEKLYEAYRNRWQLSSTELDELTWYSSEYSYELIPLQAGGTQFMPAGEAFTKDRWRIYRYMDTLPGVQSRGNQGFMVTAYPVAGYGITSTAGKTGFNKVIGAGFYGTYSDWFGASFEYADFGQFGDDVDRLKYLTPALGVNYKNAPNGIEFSDVRGSINFNWKWGSVSLRKDYNYWGHGNFGQLFISGKPASYPHIFLTLQPVPWFRFVYMHGWLNSLVPDSLSFYYNHTNSTQPFLRKKYVDKYVAANMLTVTPVEWLDVSLGNSYVYSGNLRPEAFIPFMYYKVMDHNTGREGFDDGNGQIFFDVKADYFKNLSIYSSVIIDVLEIREILKGNWRTSWFGYTLGMQEAGFILPELQFTFEYTKTNPWLYDNNDESTTYRHLNYPLGHWIGQNADLLSLQFDYTILRGLRASFTAEIFRKGGEKDVVVDAYKERKELPFLYSPLRTEKTLSLFLKYEPVYQLIAKAYYRYSDINDEDPLRTQEWMTGGKNSFGLSLSYGL